MILIFRCKECGWIGQESEIVKFPDPESSNIWNICPQCRAAEQFENICDEPECNSIATCGWPTLDNNYRRTCYKHMKKNEI